MNKRLITILLIGYCSLVGYSAYYNNSFSTGYKLEYLLLALVTPWLVHGFFKLIKLKMTKSIIVVVWVFSAIAMILGSTLGFYSYDYFDKVLHFSSGLFISILAVMIYSLLGPLEMKSKKEFILQTLMVNGFNMLVAFLWELYEFLLLMFMDIDAVNHYTTGVYDSMGDMIVCFIGGVIVSFFIYHYYVSGKKNIVYRIVQEFKDLNNFNDRSLK